MITRLHSKAPALADRILASRRGVSRLVHEAARIALENAEPSPAIRAATLSLVERRAPLDVDLRAQLRALQEEAENAYLDSMEATDSHETTDAAALTAFRRARALAALLLAVSAEDDPQQAAEVVYESLASCASSEDEARALLRLEGAL